jgi:hypothetical protein
VVSEVVKLSIVPIAKLQHDGCVATLEGLLDLARAGELTSVAVAAFGVDGSSYTAFEPGDHTAALLGCVVRLQADVLEHLAGAQE